MALPKSNTFTSPFEPGRIKLNDLDTPILALFASAFTSATLLPGSSEVLLIYLATQTELPSLNLWLAATLGNSLGGMTNWLLGFLLYKGLAKKGKIKKEPDNKSLQRLKKWGSPALLLSWVPIIGDPLCLAAGWLRIHWLPALIFIAIGKGIRYGLILGASNL